jgi:hypothetical protein
MFLQEVCSFPGWIAEEYQLAQRHPVRKTGTPQIFTNLIGVRGQISREVTLRSDREWIDCELKRFSGNLFGAELTMPGLIDQLNAVVVYSPAWPIARDRLDNVDLSDVKLQQNKDLWVSDILRTALMEAGAGSGDHWIVAGDFNMCETFDQWRGGPRGNREYLDRLLELGLVDCLRHSRGALTPTFRTIRSQKMTAQLDYIFVTDGLLSRQAACFTGPKNLIETGISDHLPVIADFDTGSNP